MPDYSPFQPLPPNLTCTPTLLKSYLTYDRNSNVHMHHLGILIKCRFCFSKSDREPEILQFYPAPGDEDVDGSQAIL